MNLGMYIGKIFPPPQGCLDLVADIWRKEFARDVPKYQDGNSRMDILRSKLVPTDDPIPGDLVLMKGEQWHVGVLVKEGYMIHSGPPDGSVVIERYDGLRWKARLKGFYRWVN